MWALFSTVERDFGTGNTSLRQGMPPLDVNAPKPPLCLDAPDHPKNISRVLNSGPAKFKCVDVQTVELTVERGSGPSC